MTLVPETSAEELSVVEINVDSLAPSTDAAASVLKLIVPVGMLLRQTSTPLTYTTAPSSRIKLRFSDVNCAGFVTVIARRKYVVMYFFLGLDPNDTIVCSPPSTYPNSPEPVRQELSLKLI